MNLLSSSTSNFDRSPPSPVQRAVVVVLWTLLFLVVIVVAVGRLFAAPPAGLHPRPVHRPPGAANPPSETTEPGRR